MDIAATSSAAAQNQSQSKTQGASQSLANNFDNFLTLLTTQLQNQDPLQPLDSNDFTQQLVSFSGVEQAIATNKNLESLIAMQTQSQAANIVNYLGTEVMASNNVATLADGKATWNYVLSQDAAATNINIVDGNGKVVFTGPGNREAGSHDFVWNGKDNASNSLPDGVYGIEVSAKNANGSSISTETFTLGLVEGIETIDGTNFLIVDGIRVSPADIIRVAKPTPAA